MTSQCDEMEAKVHQQEVQVRAGREKEERGMREKRGERMKQGVRGERRGREVGGEQREEGWREMGMMVRGMGRPMQV